MEQNLTSHPVSTLILVLVAVDFFRMLVFIVKQVTKFQPWLIQLALLVIEWGSNNHVLYFSHLAPPTVRISPEGPFVVQFNQTISLLCSSKSQRVVQFVWLLNGETISVTHRIAEYTTASNLTIPNISELGFGVYTCIVDDGFYDAVNESITVVETDELYFVGGQTTIQANTAIGGRLALVCPTVRGGIGNHTVSFVRGSSTLNSDLERVTVNSIPSGGIEVVIDPVLSEDAGRYRCTATDGVTSITLQYEVNFLGMLGYDHGLLSHLLWTVS